jgi:hypothetical protein
MWPHAAIKSLADPRCERSATTRFGSGRRQSIQLRLQVCASSCVSCGGPRHKALFGMQQQLRSDCTTKLAELVNRPAVPQSDVNFADASLRDRFGDYRCLRALGPVVKLGRVLINRDRLVRLARCPLCPDSDQIPQRSETTRCANNRHRLPYSITSSVVASGDGTVRPSVLAVLRLITSSNLVGCSTGRSAGFAPLKILSMCGI